MKEGNDFHILKPMFTRITDAKITIFQLHCVVHRVKVRELLGSKARMAALLPIYTFLFKPVPLQILS